MESTANGREATHMEDASPLIGIVIKQYGSSYFGGMLDAAGKYLLMNGYEIVVQASDVTYVGEYNACMSLLNHGCDGVIVHSDDLSNTQLSDMLQTHPNVVMMNRLVPGYESRCVHFDNKHGAELAAQHLIQNGHTQIAMITGKREIRDVSERTTEFTAALNMHGIELHSDLVVEGNFMQESGSRSLEILLKSEKDFTAVFAQNDAMAIGFVQACRAVGISVPQDISVIGFDDHENAAVLTPSLTTIRQSISEFGVRAGTMMHRLLSGTDTGEQLPSDYGTINPLLIQRDSVLNLNDVQQTRRFNGPSLTVREIECLKWTAAGKTSWEISKILSVTESAVVFHMRNVLRKLNASNRVHAVALAISMSIIEAPSNTLLDPTHY